MRWRRDHMALVARLAQAEIRSQEFYPHIPNEWQGPTHLVHLPLLYAGR